MSRGEDKSGVFVGEETAHFPSAHPAGFSVDTAPEDSSKPAPDGGVVCEAVEEGGRTFWDFSGCWGKRNPR